VIPYFTLETCLLALEELNLRISEDMRSYFSNYITWYSSYNFILFFYLHFLRLFVTYLHFHFVVTMQAQKEAPPDMQCKDKFLIQSVVATARAAAKDITSKMVTNHK